MMSYVCSVGCFYVFGVRGPVVWWYVSNISNLPPSPKTIKLKAEARLDLLRQVGVAVDTWLKSAMNQVCYARQSL